VEQKNSTHIRNVLGHLRYDTEKEVEIINELYQDSRTLQELFPASDETKREDTILPELLIKG